MAVFQYEARSLEGTLIQGKLDIASKEDLKYKLLNDGLILQKAKKIGRANDENFLDKIPILNRVKHKDFILFCRQFEVILNSGVSIVEAIKTSIKQTTNKKLSKALTDIYDRILEGQMLSDAFASRDDVFPDMFIQMVRVGEMSGNLDFVLRSLVVYYDKQYKIIKKVKSASTYPAVVSVASLGIVLFLMIKIVPMFGQTLDSMGGELPALTAAIMAISNFLVDHTILIILAIIGSAIGVVYYAKTDSGKRILDQLKLKIPLINNFTSKAITSNVARSMSLLLSSGMPLVSALNILKRVIGNVIITEKFDGAVDMINNGHKFVDALDSVGIFPPIFLHMVGVGEETGEMESMLNKSADFFDEEIDEAVSRILTMIEPLLILSLALIVGVIMASVLLPIVSMMNVVG
ncbi:type II secretion system F family protein [Acidaminobacter sp. JC074]|uniref:type II secretion system F family protein n=1 Tax=Acidaminobacter sp. JC074 TaxID=2530199 RepID=UPI001F10ED11|nr:type II secretion system F family protein [Acidaminobacter sp. JC074]MCH4888184.1 type II secretion system F family protein [Acidaminobacter sp. JC074]